ncbi:MAG: permease [Ignavibacteriae bacterium]|nr:permease [Ignavibacteriota bacterium]
MDVSFTRTSIIAIDAYHNIHTLLDGTYTLRIIENFFELALATGPYLVLSIALNVLLTRYVALHQVRLPVRGEYASIAVAALLGLLSPLPTYAAIPIALSVASAGVPLSAILAFVVSSPLMNPGVFLLTASQLGLEMALVRSAAAFIIGVLAGICTMTIPLALQPPAKPSPRQIPAQPLKQRSIGQEFYRSARYAGKYFSLAILLSAAVKALVPAQTVSNLLGGGGATGTLVAIGMGVPFYTCGGAAIPFMQTLMGLGMSKGATLAFFTAGPATKVETLYAFKSQLGARILVLYLSLTLGFSFVAGWLYSFF